MLHGASKCYEVYTIKNKIINSDYNKKGIYLLYHNQIH